MNTQLQCVRLKTGETMAIVRVTAPDEEFRDRILAFLDHKGEPWLTPIRENLHSDLEGLQQHFYLGVLGEQIVGNASSIEALARPVSLLQHVFTSPEWRRRGVCSALIRTYVEDFDARGGRAAYLHTGYDTEAYHIYRRAGFVGYLDTGHMERFPDPAFHQDFWAPRPTTVRQTRWSDWALLDALFGIVDGWYLRSLYAGCWGRSYYEGTYVHMRRQMREGVVSQVNVLEADNGAVVGLAHLSKDFRFLGDVWMLDIFVHPNYYSDGAKLLSAMNFELGAKVQCYCDSQQPEKAEMLQEAGFTLEAKMPRQVRRGNEWLDLTIYSRS